MLIELACLGMLTTSTMVSGLVFQHLQASRRCLRIIDSHRAQARSVVQKSRMDLMEVRNRTKLLEDTVSGGASAVEKVHKAISSTTFGLIDLFSRDEGFRQGARKARQNHDRTSREVYQAVRTTNRALHILADTLIIGKAEKRIVKKTKKAP